MAVTTVDPYVSYMVLMAEWHWLFSDHANSRHIRGTHNKPYKPHGNGRNQYCTEYRDARDGVHRWMKAIRHSNRVSLIRPSCTFHVFRADFLLRAIRGAQIGYDGLRITNGHAESGHWWPWNRTVLAPSGRQESDNLVVRPACQST